MSASMGMSLKCPSVVPLRQEDIQIAEKDKQIAQLMEQAKNYQVLSQAQQVLSLPAPKRSFFKRLFGIHEEKE